MNWLAENSRWNFCYSTVLREKSHESSDIANFTLINYEFSGKLVDNFLPIFHIFLFVILSKISEKIINHQYLSKKSSFKRFIAHWWIEQSIFINFIPSKIFGTEVWFFSMIFILVLRNWMAGQLSLELYSCAPKLASKFLSLVSFESSSASNLYLHLLFTVTSTILWKKSFFFFIVMSTVRKKLLIEILLWQEN